MPLAYYKNDITDLIDPMVHSFLANEKARLFTLLADIIKRNHALGGHVYGFYYNGLCVSQHAPRHTKGQPLSGIDPAVILDYENYDLQNSKLRLDERKLTNCLTVVLSRCTSVQDVRDVLPEPLAMIPEALRQLPRIRAEGFILDENPMLRKQFEKAIDIALYYQANRLIY